MRLKKYLPWTILFLLMAGTAFALTTKTFQPSPTDDTKVHGNSINVSGDWTGTFDNQEGTYYLNASNLTNFGGPFFTFFSATNTDALTQGSTNKYYADSLARSAFSESDSLLTYNSGTGVWGTNGLYNFSASLASTSLSILNVGIITATTGTSFINGLTLGSALPVASGGTALNSVGAAGTVLMVSGGVPAWTATATCAQITGDGGLCDGNDATGAGGGVYPFTPTDFNGAIYSATTSNLWVLGGGFYASSTSNFSTTTVQGSLNVGTLTATSGTSYLNALSLGTALADANINSATTWNAKESALTFNSPLSRSVNTISCNCSYPFTPTSHFGNIISATTTSVFLSGSAGIYASSTSYLSTTTISGALNTGTITATSGTSYLNALSLGTALPTGSGGTAVSSAGTAGNVLMSNGSVWVSSATATCAAITGDGGLCDGNDATGAGGGVYPFTPTSNFNTITSATSSVIWGTVGIFASSTSRFAGISLAGLINFVGMSSSSPVTEGCTANITADATQNINVDGCQTLSVTSDNTTSTNRTFCITGGTNGQLLILFADVVGSNEIELVDTFSNAACSGSNDKTMLASVWPATTNQNNDVLILIFRSKAGGWFEIARAAN